MQPEKLVRFQLRQLVFTAGSFNGRMGLSESLDVGSIPTPATQFEKDFQMSELTATRRKSHIHIVAEKPPLTDAEEKVASALNHLRLASIELSGIVIDECHGKEKFKPVAVQDALVDVLDVKRLLENARI